MESRVVQLRASPATFQGLMDTDRRLGVGREPDLVLAFLPPRGLADTLSAMAEVWPSSRRLGCETSGQVANGELGTKGVLQFFWLENPAHALSVELITGTQEELPDEEAMGRLWRRLDGADAALLLADGVRFPHSKLLGELRRRERDLPPILGVLASRGDGGRDGGCHVFVDTEVSPSACLAVALRGITMDVGVIRGFEAASPVYSVTRAAGGVVYEIDGEPATLWYRRFFTAAGRLLPLPETSGPFPLLIEGPDPARRGLYRSMVGFDEGSGTVSFRGDVRVGDRIRLGIRRPGGLEDAVRAAADRRPQAVILSTSLGWDLLSTDETVAADFAGAYEELSVPLGGLSSFGEIAPGADRSLVLHNQVTILAALREVAS